MKNHFVSFGLLIFETFSFAQNNIVVHGIPDSIYSKEYPEFNNYNSQIIFPPFIGWSLSGKKMLFNGGKSIYSMKTYSSEIKDYMESDRSFSSLLSPDHNYFLYQEDEDGDEDYQLFLYNISSNTSQPLSNKGDKTYNPFWNPNNKQIAYKSNKDNPAIVDLYISDISDDNKEILIFEDFSDDGEIHDWSSEKNLILVVKIISENDKLLYLINDQSYEIEQINRDKRNIAYAAAQFIPNQNACLVVSDEFSEFLQLHHYDLTTKKFETITSDIPWDVEAITTDQKGDKAAFSINRDGLSQLYILDLQTLNYKKVDQFPEGIIRDLKINPTGTEVGFNFYSSTFRRKVYGYELRSETLNHYTRKGKPQKESKAFTIAKRFTFNSIDPDTGMEHKIPAFIYSSNKQNSPVFIDIHGGPEYQVRASFNQFYQYLVNELGITVIVPNIRGSDGYGKSYMMMDDGFNRENAIEDIGALLDWIKEQGNLDPDNVAVFGESYGGYVVLASLAKYSDRLKCGIDGFGISNWITYLNNTSDYRRDLRRVEFGDERDPEMYQYLKRISPVNSVDKINSPLLIIQGLNDPRVNYKESEQMYESLNADKKEVWYVLAKDEGHGFHKYKNGFLKRNLIISFLKKHLSIE